MTSASSEPGATTLTISVAGHETTVTLTATGEIDMMTAPRLEQAARQALEDTPPVLVLDLSEVDFLSSAGLATLVKTNKLAGEQTDLRIVAAGPATRRPLQLMGLDQDLALYATLADAVADLPPR